MGTLGAYLKSAREARGVDLHDAAQQTRININYLKAMEGEDFSKLPGEVFVRGFLKSYAKFLRLEEEEVVKRYQELQPATNATAAVPNQRGEAKKAPVPVEEKRPFPVEPLAWGMSILIGMTVLLFIAIKDHPRTAVVHPAPHVPAEQVKEPALTPDSTPVKLYLEIIAQEDVWILVRTDVSPQKKAFLKKGESVIWSADERFLLSYGSAGAVHLLLNGAELFVKAPKGLVVRDLVITAGGIAEQKLQTQQPARKPKPKPQPGQSEQAQPAATQQPSPAATAPATTPASETPALPFTQPQ